MATDGPCEFECQILWMWFTFLLLHSCCDHNLPYSLTTSQSLDAVWFLVGDHVFFSQSAYITYDFIHSLKKKLEDFSFEKIGWGTCMCVCLYYVHYIVTFFLIVSNILNANFSVIIVLGGVSSRRHSNLMCVCAYIRTHVRTYGRRGENKKGCWFAALHLFAFFFILSTVIRHHHRHHPS